MPLLLLRPSHLVLNRPLLPSLHQHSSSPSDSLSTPVSSSQDTKRIISLTPKLTSYYPHESRMNLRIVPAVQSSPTVIFSLNWHNLPSSLPLPNFYSGQFAACQDASIPSPRNTLALDKAVGFHLLLESVTFDLARGVVAVAWLDKRVQEWAIEDVQGLKSALEDVLDCVRQSGEEADREKKAAAAAAAQAKAGHSHSASVTSTSDTTSTPSSSSAHKRHRTASGIFSSLVASFITPPSSPDPNAPAQLYRARRSKTVSGGVVPLIHKQNIFHPSNKRENFPANSVPQSRFLRRQARAKLVDVFRFYVATRLTSEMRASGIVGDELKERGILDDLDADEEDGASAPGTSGYAAAGGYVAYMARSMLRNALAEAKADEDSLSSSSEDSLLLTPPNNSDTSLPSDTSSKSRPSSSSSSGSATSEVLSGEGTIGLVHSAGTLEQRVREASRLAEASQSE